MSCPTCGAVGKVARFPVVAARFEAHFLSSDVTDEGRRIELDIFPGRVLAEAESPDGTAFQPPLTLPETMRRTASAELTAFVHRAAGRVRRAHAVFACVPYAECELSYRGRSFAARVSGVTRRVEFDGRVPLSGRWLTGLCLGLPLVVAGGVAVVWTHAARGPQQRYALVSIVALVVAVWYFGWAMLSRPRSKRPLDDPPDA